MEYDLIPEDILEALKNRGLTREDIETSTPNKLFDEYARWHGFSGWSGTFINAIDELRYARKAI